MRSVANPRGIEIESIQTSIAIRCIVHGQLYETPHFDIACISELKREQFRGRYRVCVTQPVMILGALMAKPLASHVDSRCVAAFLAFNLACEDVNESWPCSGV